MLEKSKISKVTLTLAISLSLLFTSCQSTCEQVGDSGIKENETKVLADFEHPGILSSLSFTADFTDMTLSDEEAFVRLGKHSLKLSALDTADNSKGGRPELRFDLKESFELSDYKEIRFWFYASQEASEFFFGRYDLMLFVNHDSFNKRWSAITPGWKEYVWDLKTVTDMPEVKNLRFQFGPLLEGYEKTDLYLDHIVLVPMDTVAPNADLRQVVLKDKSWSRRYQALKHLAENNSKDLLKMSINACGDSSPAIRLLAVKIMSDYVSRHGKSAIPDLEEGMNGSNRLARLAVIKLITQVEKELGDWAQDSMRRALYDETYYVRWHVADHLISKGISKAKLASMAVGSLADSDTKRKRATLRLLAEIGPRAKDSIPAILKILRNSDRDHLIRCWALRAVWQIDEDYLEPSDWILALDLEPGQIHRHLLNRAMDRLESAGSKSVPALVASFHATNPELVARACAILGNMGVSADSAVSDLKKVAKHERWYLASEAERALRKILPDYKPSAKKPVSNTGTDVSVKRSGEYTTISNGLIELVFKDGDDNPGPQIVRKVGGENVVDAEWLPEILAFRYSKAPNMIERQWLQRLFGSPFPRKLITKIHSSTPEAVDYMIKFVGDEKTVTDWEYHYVLRKGAPGFYSYIVISNSSGKEVPKHITLEDQFGLGRFTYLLGLTWGMFDHLYIDDKLKGPAAFIRYNEYKLNNESYPDIYQSALRLPDGEIFAKHEWENYELNSHVNGYAGKEGGFWMIFPDFDFFGDSMPRHKATMLFGNIFVPHLEGKYYSQILAHVTKDWTKTYGPMFFYLNDGENEEEMWVDAKRQAEEEIASWPYEWLELDEYKDRGTVTGILAIANGTSAEGAYVVLSNPSKPLNPDQCSIWMRDASSYHHWTQVNADGSFTIDNVHSGSYDLYAFKPGIYGELEHGKISISRGQATDVGALTLSPKENGRLVWQIGSPDGGSQEYKNGRSYHQWDTYIKYREDFSTDVHFTIGKSDWFKDWNYMHPAKVRGEKDPTIWTIDFDLEGEVSKKHLLTIVCAGRYAHAIVSLNGKPIGKIDILHVGYNHMRTAPYGGLIKKEFEIDPQLLRSGKNSIEITFDLSIKAKEGLTEAPVQSKDLEWTSFLAYDFLRLEELDK